MKRDQLLRELRKIAREQGKTFEIFVDKGKGSHMRVKLGEKTTIIQDGEMNPGYVKLIQRQLEI
ncbi:hypothetical protein [Phyllobacterium sp. P5_D12]